MAEKRNRRTAAEMAEHYRAMAARCEAIAEGKGSDNPSQGIVKRLKARLRKTNTELRAAQITINGVATEDRKGFVRSPIADKIAGTIKRLESQRETQARAEEFTASLPFDVERLTALVAAAEQGEDVEFPTDLVRLSNEEEKTDEQHEAAHIAGEEDTAEGS